jgi:ATP-dependent helicase HrpA
MPEAIAKAVDELARGSREGDILVFLPGEREIREAAESLRKHHPANTEILPLFSRLSAEEQDRVFERSSRRRIVLATNVAETSLTVPGIHFVVDTGLARVRRYSPRQKIDQLRIEPVSQAAARQRAGRCGRVASGIAIRLYAEEDFTQRPEYTTPEILRTSLASVILRMAALELGPIAEFPFIEPPTPRQVEDGYRQLFELGAIDRGVPPTGTGSDNRALTPLGHELARLPVDPREFHCLSRWVILAARSRWDPRDRPQQFREQSTARTRSSATTPPISAAAERGSSSTESPQEVQPQALETAASISSRTCGCASGATSRAAARDGLRAQDPRQRHARDL